MELYVIRHTEVHNPDNLCYGNFDIPLLKDYELKSDLLFYNLPNNIDQILIFKPDIIFNSLHGEFGEDGGIHSYAQKNNISVERKTHIPSFLVSTPVDSCG